MDEKRRDTRLSSPGNTAKRRLRRRAADGRLYRLLFENMPDGAAYCRMLYDDGGAPHDFVYVMVNEAYGRLTGLEDVVGRRFSDVVPGVVDAHPELFRIYGRVAKSGVPERFEIEMKPLGRWFAVSAFGAEKDHFVAVIKNISERKRTECLLHDLNLVLERRVAERTGELTRANRQLMEEIGERIRAQESLRLSEAKYRALFENGMDAIFLTVPDGGIREVNRAACRMFGMTEEELVSARREQLIDPADERLPALLEERARTGRILCELSYLRRDGTTFPAETSSCLLDDGSRSFVMLRDITGRKNAERELRRANAYNRSLIEASLDPLVTIGPDGRITDVNSSTEEITGYPRGELIGTDFSDYFVDREAAGRGYRTVFREGTVRDYPLEIRHRDGHTTAVLYNATVYRGEDGNVIGVFAAARDITERKRAEETLRRYARRLLEMEEDLRRELAADLHDEIGRDLTALGINLSLIRRQLPEEHGKRLGGRVDDSARLVEEVTRSVRNIMNGLHPPMLDDYGLPAALRWYGEQFSRRTGVEVRVLVDGACHRLRPERETALFRIAQEALTNVAKHAGARNVSVTLGSSSGVCRLTIADDGRGFAGETVAKRGECSGWGVTVMRERAQLAGGVLHLESAPGAGTTVTVEMGTEG